MATVQGEAYYGTFAGHPQTIYPDTEKNRKLMAQATENWRNMSSTNKCGVVCGALFLFGLIGIIICAVNDCYVQQSDKIKQGGCDTMCDSTVKVLTIGAAIIGLIGACVSCFSGK